MEDQGNSRIVNCLDEGILISLEEGDVSFEEYAKIVDHCMSCRICAQVFAGREREIRGRRPQAVPIFALNAPSRFGCLTVEEIVHFKSNHQRMSKIYTDYVVTHSCSCPRCYEVSYQLKGFEASDDMDHSFVCIPLRSVVNDLMLKQIVGDDGFRSICLDLECEMYELFGKKIEIVDFCDYAYQIGVTESKAVLLDYRGSDVAGKRFRVSLVEYEEGAYCEDISSF